MYRKYYLVEVVLLLLLSHGGWNGPSVTLHSCTSESSKLVRDVVEKRFLSVVERYRVSLPLECPLHPKRDMFWVLRPDIQATRREGEEWHCPVCGRRFGCENTFVTHWDVTHSRTLLGMTGETVCLDDYCDVFRCDVLKRKMLRTRMEEEDELRTHHHPAGSQGISIFQHRHRDAEDDEEIKEKKMNCDARALSQVHHKCRSLIRQCTLGMVANLSSKDFQDIEEDLDQSICSFLTCDKYWDDFDPHIHRVPVLVFAVFGLLITSLFCFCYYGLWVLLEKSPINSNQVCCSCQKSSSIDGYYRMKRQKHRHKQNSPEYPVKPNSLEYVTKKNLNDYSTKPFSPENTITKQSSETNAKQNSTEYYSRKNSPDYDSSRNSPEYDSRLNSPEYNSRQNSPEYNSRENSPEYTSRENSPEYISRKNSPEYSTRGNSLEYNTRRISPEYNSRQNSPEYNSRQNSPHEFFPKRISSDYCSRENSPEYNSRENSPDFQERQNSPEFELRQNSSHNQYYHNSSGYKQKSLDIHQRKKPQIISSQSANTLHLPQKVLSRVN